MLAAVLALASSLSWGLSDFLGGFHSRRHPLLAVMVVSQGFAFVLLVVALAGREAGEPDAQARRTTRASIALALVAALGFGTFFVGIDQAEQSADVPWVLLAARGPETLVLVVAFVLSRARLPRERG